jgi:Holliday junction resolvasome RuvABC DNA-binding subunit
VLNFRRQSLILLKLSFTLGCSPLESTFAKNQHEVEILVHRNNRPFAYVSFNDFTYRINISTGLKSKITKAQEAFVIAHERCHIILGHFGKSVRNSLEKELKADECALSTIIELGYSPYEAILLHDAIDEENQARYENLISVLGALGRR